MLFRSISIPKSSIDRILATKFAGLSITEVSCEIEDTTLAVNPEHFQWIADELVEHILIDRQSGFHLKIHGEVMDNAFHLSLSSCQQQASNPGSLDSEMSKLVQFNSPDDEDGELEIGLKIVKKIVELYDGIFLMSGGIGEAATFYLTLPLAISNLSGIKSQSIVTTFK